MDEQAQMTRAIQLLSTWLTCVQLSNAVDYYDINKVSERVAMDLLNATYDMRLKDLNDEQRNFPAVDLGDDDAKIAFQITSTVDDDKVRTTLEKFVDHKLHERFTNGVRFFLLSSKDVRLGKRCNAAYAAFDAGHHVVTQGHLIQRFRSIYQTDRQRFARILQVLERTSTGPTASERARRVPPNTLPPRRLFVGRETEIVQLETALTRDGYTSIPQASLWGLGGVGKTALALEYAHRALEQETYPGGVWWVVAEGMPVAAIVQLATAVRKHAPALMADVRPDATTEELAEATKRALEVSSEPSLLVLDNVSERGFAEMLPGNQVRVLITTRERRLSLGKAIELDVLPLDHARQLAIDLGAAPTREEDDAALTRVVQQQLGLLVVAVEVAARAVSEWAGGWVAYERQLVQRMNEALDGPEDRSEHYPRGVFAAIDLSIGRCGDLACRLLEGAVVFAPDAVPIAWACAAADVDLETIAVQRAFGNLEGLGLVKVDRQAEIMSIHRLVHKRVRDQVEPAEMRVVYLRAVEHVANWLKDMVGPAREQMGAVDTLRAHIVSVLSAEQAEAAIAWGLLADRLATHLQHRAEYHEALSLFGRALASSETAFGAEHPNVAATLSNLAVVLQVLGDAAGARPLLERALTIAEKAFGAEHPNVATHLSNLAMVLRDLGDAAGARPLLQRAISIDEKPPGLEPENAAKLATHLSNLGLVLRDLGDAAGARPLFQRAISIDEKTFGPEHPDVARDLTNLGLVLRDLGDAAGARLLFERVVTIADKTFGPEHPFTSTSLSNLGLALHDLGDALSARTLLERALAITERTFGPEHAVVAKDLSNLAAVIRDLGDAAGAQPLLERALAITEKTFGPQHPLMSRILSNLAGVFQFIGDAAGARTLLERALAITENAFGPEHPDCAGDLSRLALALRDLGDTAGARPLLERALVIYEKNLGLNHPEIAILLSNLATLFRDLEDAVGARPLLERALAISEKTLGPEHLSTALSLSELAMLHQDLGDVAEARPLLERALAISEKTLGSDHPTVATIRLNLLIVLGNLDVGHY